MPSGGAGAKGLSQELEIAAEAAVAAQAAEAFAAGHAHGHARTGACANCGAILQGPYCHICGQNADDHKRSILHLAWEAVEGFLHLDGRLRRTVPDLFFHPGRLARDYMDGRIARHVPPFRTFLVALLIFIFAAEHATHEIQAAQDAQHRARAAESGHAAKAAPASPPRPAPRRPSDHDGDLADAAKDRDDDLEGPRREPRQGAGPATPTCRGPGERPLRQRHGQEPTASPRALPRKPPP